MGLLTILRKLREKEREMRLLILGLDNAGKTTMVLKFNGDDIDNIEPTLGEFYAKMHRNNGAIFLQAST